MATVFGIRPANIGPRVQVVKGFDVLETQQAQTVAPVADDVTVYSGQLLKIADNSGAAEFDLATIAHTGEFAIAYQDSADNDVVASGKLTGLPVSGQFEIMTPWYTTDETYPIGTKLTVGANGRVIPVGSTDVLAGAAPIVGVVTGGVVDVAGENSTAAKDANGKVYMLRFRTAWIPNNVKA